MLWSIHKLHKRTDAIQLNRWSPAFSLTFSPALLVIAGLIPGFLPHPVFGLTASALAQYAGSSDPERQLEAADVLVGHAGAAGDVSRAFSLYQAAADAGNAEAQFVTGYMLVTGRGTALDRKTARAYFSRAANVDHPAATQWMGVMAAEAGEDQDAVTGWYSKAVALKAPGSEDSLATALMKQPATAGRLVILFDLAFAPGTSKDVKTRILNQDYLPLLGKEDAEYLQEQLLMAGFDPKGRDGLIGPNSRKALAAYRASQNRKGAVLSIEDLKGLRFF